MKRGAARSKGKKRAAEWNADALPMTNACALCDERLNALKQPTLGELLDVFLAFYREQRVVGVDVEDEGDMLMSDVSDSHATVHVSRTRLQHVSVSSDHNAAEEGQGEWGERRKEKKSFCLEETRRKRRPERVIRWKNLLNLSKRCIRLSS
jgi:hypothetical protein